MTQFSLLGRAKSKEKGDDLSITLEHYQCITVSEMCYIIDLQSVDKTDISAIRANRGKTRHRQYFAESRQEFKIWGQI